VSLTASCVSECYGSMAGVAMGEFTSMLAAKSWIPFARAPPAVGPLCWLHCARSQRSLLETVDCEVCEWMYVRALRTKAQ